MLGNGDEVDQCHFRSTRGALFFGVPNCGIDQSSLVSMMKRQPNRDFVDSLSIGSAFLKYQSQIFPTLFNFRDSIIFSFYETRLSPKAIMVGKGDCFSRLTD